MQKKQQGFTLIELMIVVTIIGTLAALAIPAYQDYTIRAQISEGLTLSAGAKTAVTDYYMQRGAWPIDNKGAGLADKKNIKGKYTKEISIKGNVIDIQYGYDAHQEIFDERLQFTGVDNDGSISWTCASKAGKIRVNHLPAACR